MPIDAFLSPSDLALFQNNVAAADPYGLAAKSLMSWQPDYSHLGPVESGITAFGRSFLAGLLQNYGAQQNAEQLSAVVNVLPQLRADPFSVATPEGVDSGAFNALRGTAILKSAEREATKGETTDKMLNETLLKLFDKGVETYQIDPNKALSAVVEAKKTGDLNGISELLQSTVGTTPPPAAVTAAAPSVAAALPTTTTAAPPLPTGQVVAPVVEKTREQLFQEYLPKYRGNVSEAGKAADEAFNAQKLQATTSPILAAIGAKVPKELQDNAIKESGTIQGLTDSFARIDELYKKGEEKSSWTALLPEVVGINSEYLGKIGIPLPTTEAAKNVQSINAEIEAVVSTVLKGTGSTQEADFKRKMAPLLPAYLDSPDTRATKIEAIKNMMLEAVRTKGGTPILEQFGIAKLPTATAPYIPNTPTVGSEMKNRLMSVLGGDLPETDANPMDVEALSQNYDFMGQMFKPPQTMADAEKLGKEGPLPVQAAMEEAVKTHMKDNGMSETEAKLRVFEDMKNGTLNMDKAKVEQIDGGAFVEKVDKIAADLDANPEHILAVMNFETGGTFDPAVKNAAGSGATGLIQFTPATAKELTKEDTGAAAIKVLAAMSPTEQLDYVKKHLAPFKGKLDSLQDVYMAVLYPKAVGKDASYALFKEGTKAYWQNRGLDINDDGVITKAEATKKVEEFKV